MSESSPSSGSSPVNQKTSAARYNGGVPLSGGHHDQQNSSSAGNDGEKEGGVRSPGNNQPIPINTTSSGRSRNISDSRHTAEKISSTLKRGAHQKKYNKMPFLRRPQAAEDGPWLQEEHQATEWLALFYDLAVVAVLSIFSSTHELSSPSAIPIFISYFVVISWTWTSQIHYDIRYQAEDAFHRHIKSLQIMVFIYIGAASGNWEPSNIRDPAYHDPPLTGKAATLAQEAGQSFRTVLIAFAISRTLLGIQYAVSAVLGHKSGRKVSSQLCSLGSVAVCLVFVIIAVCVPAHSYGTVSAKISLFYFGILAELIGIWIQMRRKLQRHISTVAVAERYSALTLIILGEGFISVTRAFNRAVSGLGANDTSAYSQPFLSITIIFMLWLFLFSRFRKEDEVAQRRALLWEAIHFPLHLGLLLLLAAIVNTIVVLSFAQGINAVSQQFQETIAFIQNGTAPDPTFRSQTEANLNRLTLEPDYPTEVGYLQSLAAMQDPIEDPTILAYQYFGQIVVQTTISYGLTPSTETLDTLQDLYSANTTWSGDDTVQESRRDTAGEQLLEVIRIPVDESLSGILWLFPTAGAVLILAAIRQLLWYHFSGPAHIIVHSGQIIFGIALALLGLLDIGSRDIDVLAKDQVAGTNPMYSKLLDNELPLVIVAVVYLLVYFGSSGLLELVHRRKGNVWADEEEGEKGHHT